MRFYAQPLLTLLFAVQVFAVFQDEAYHVDFHYALLGSPKQDSTFFHRPQATSSASLLYTLSEKLVLGAVNPKDGSIVWRHDLSKLSSKGASPGILRAKLGENTVVSGIGNHVSAWDAADGRLVWESQFGEDEIVRDLEIVDDASNLSKVAVLLGREHGVVKTLDGQTGETKGTFVDDSGDVPFQVSSAPSGLYYFSLHSTLLKGLKLKVTALDPNTQRQVSQYTLSSDSEVTSPDAIIFVGANSAAPVIAWTDRGHKTLKINVIGSKNVQSINIDNDTGEEIEKVAVHAPQTANALSHFLVHYRTESRDWAEVYHVDLKRSTISKAYQLPKLMGKGGTFSTSVIDANVYFTRITQSEVSLVSSASHGLLGRWTMPLDFSDAVHAVSEVVARGSAEFAVRFGLVTDGSWFLIRNGDLVWTRPEGLAGAVAAAWVDSEEGEMLKHELEIEGHGNIIAAYVHRVRRHAEDLRHLPEWIASLPARISSSIGHSNPLSSFGFNKIVIVGTDSGRVMAVDAGDGGRILWNHNIFAETSSKPNITTITVDGRVAYVYADDGTVLKLDALSGAILRAEGGDSYAQGFVSVPENPTLIPIHSDGSPSSTRELKGGAIVTLSDNGQAQGWKMGATASKLWEFQAPSGQKLLGIISRPPHDPVASAGKVLGDRSVLYKHLNPNLALITSASASTATFHLIDSISGQVLHSATYDGIDTSLPIPSVMSENWFAYSFYADPKTPAGSKGYRLVISELYESPISNDRGPLDSASNFSSLDPATATVPFVISQSFTIPEGISHMSVTQSRQGITTRQILCTLSESNGIVGIPRPFLDPRRPVDRDATANEMEEGLFKYSPVLDFDPKWYLTHTRDVMGVRDVITIPSTLESTSLVVAFGHDLFGTRVAPSGSFDILGKEFSKIQLVITVVALSAGVAVLAPMVRKRQVDTRWKM